jgi:hypothetical protein
MKSELDDLAGKIREPRTPILECFVEVTSFANALRRVSTLSASALFAAIDRGCIPHAIEPLGSGA